MPRTGDVLHFELLDLFGEFLQRGLLALENAVIRQQGLVQGEWSGCHTGNGEKLSSSQADPGQTI